MPTPSPPLKMPLQTRILVSIETYSSVDLFNLGDPTKYPFPYSGQASDDPRESPFGGEYGGPRATADSPPTDVYPSGDDPGSFNFQATQAADYAYNFLLEMSQMMPPLPLNLTSDTEALNGNNTTKISFNVKENHTPNVFYTDSPGFEWSDRGHAEVQCPGRNLIPRGRSSV